jgi:hypothetical protein
MWKSTSRNTLLRGSWSFLIGVPVDKCLKSRYYSFGKMRDQNFVVFYDMLQRVLNTPDPADLLGVKGLPRGHHLTVEGDVKKREILKRDLGQAYVQWRRHDAGQDISMVVGTFIERSRLKIVHR